MAEHHFGLSMPNLEASSPQCLPSVEVGGNPDYDRKAEQPYCGPSMPDLELSPRHQSIIAVSENPNCDRKSEKHEVLQFLSSFTNPPNLVNEKKKKKKMKLKSFRNTKRRSLPKGSVDKTVLQSPKVSPPRQALDKIMLQSPKGSPPRAVDKITLQRKYCKRCRNAWSIKSSKVDPPLSLLPKSWLEHLTVDVKANCCTVCTEMFSDEITLREHVRKHLLVQCLLCGLFFNEIELLKAHMECTHPHPKQNSFQQSTIPDCEINSNHPFTTKDIKSALCRTKRRVSGTMHKKNNKTGRVSKVELNNILNEKYVVALRSSITDQPETSRRITRSSSTFQHYAKNSNANRAVSTASNQMIPVVRLQHCSLFKDRSLQSFSDSGSSNEESLINVDVSDTDLGLYKEPSTFNNLKSNNANVTNPVDAEVEDCINESTASQQDDSFKMMTEEDNHLKTPCNNDDVPCQEVPTPILKMGARIEPMHNSPDTRIVASQLDNTVRMVTLEDNYFKPIYKDDTRFQPHSNTKVNFVRIHNGEIVDNHHHLGNLPSKMAGFSRGPEELFDCPPMPSSPGAESDAISLSPSFDFT